MKVYRIISNEGTFWGPNGWTKKGNVYHSENMARQVVKDNITGIFRWTAEKTGIKSYSIEEYNLIHSRTCQIGYFK